MKKWLQLITGKKVRPLPEGTHKVVLTQMKRVETPWGPRCIVTLEKADD